MQPILSYIRGILEGSYVDRQPHHAKSAEELHEEIRDNRPTVNKNTSRQIHIGRISSFVRMLELQVCDSPKSVRIVARFAKK